MKIYRGTNLLEEVNRRKSSYISEVAEEIKKSNTTVPSIVLKERDFVDEVRKYYIEDNSDTILVVSGLRSTGKTFGLLQTVESHLSDTLYIIADYDEKDVTAQDYIDELDKASEKYIIIDEYSWIKNREELDKSLYSYVNHPNVNERKRIMITGTDSIALDSLNRGGLIHRAIYKNVNLFTYQEFCRLYYKEYSAKTRMEYIKKGGIFLQDAINDYNDMRNYIQFAVIDNLSNSIQMDKQTAKAIIYDIIYLAVCPSKERKVHLPQANDINYQNMLRRIGIDPEARFSETDLRIVGDMLVKTGFVVKTYNFADVMNGKMLEDCRFRYNLTNPSIAYQMLKTFFNEISAERRIGMVFEASVVAYMHNHLIDQDELYFIDLTDKPYLGNPELEIVIVNQEERKIYLMDAKKENNDILKKGQSLISHKLEEYFEGYSIAGRYVICNVSKEIADVRDEKKVIFTNIESDTLQYYDFFDENYETVKKGKGLSTPPLPPI